MTEPHNIETLMSDLGRRARAAASALAATSGEQRNAALIGAATALRGNTQQILEANARDLESAKQNNASAAMLDRLALDTERVEGIAQGLEAIVALPDPVGRVMAEWQRPNGLRIQRVAVPLGVIGIIYESRPNVTADAAGLCLKSGNAVILRGGSDSFGSSNAIYECMREGLRSVAASPDWFRKHVSVLD